MMSASIPFPSKYNIGQKFYAIKKDSNIAVAMCKCCNQSRWDLLPYIVENCEYEIIGIYFEVGMEPHYKLYKPCVVAREKISESELEQDYYLSREAAQTECDVRNNRII